MTTLESLLGTITSKEGFMRLAKIIETPIPDTSADYLISYQIVYRQSNGMIAIETTKIYVTDLSLPTENAEWYGAAPLFVTGPLSSVFVSLLNQKIEAVMTANALIKRIVMLELMDTDTCAVVAAYIADAATPTKVTKTKYFAYDDAGVIKFYPYFES